LTRDAGRRATPQNGWQLAHRLLRQLFPAVHRELETWRAAADRIGDPTLRALAISSLSHKRFHCEGGAALAAPQAGAMAATLVPLITAYQTLVDYLDSVGDRSGSTDPEEARTLHAWALWALQPSTDGSEHGPSNAHARGDEGYLRALVLACHEGLALLPHYPQVRARVLALAQQYCELQVSKHGPAQVRRKDLEDWALAQPTFGMRWNEVAAAAGSTLGIFVLFEAASHVRWDAGRAEQVLACYVPWMGAVHILLDYLVDREEDEIGGDLSLLAGYHDADETFERLQHLVTRARSALQLVSVAAAGDAGFHRMILDGLLALYLADPKIGRQPRVRRVAMKLLRAAPWRVRIFWLGCRLYRGDRMSMQTPDGGISSERG